MFSIFSIRKFFSISFFLAVVATAWLHAPSAAAATLQAVHSGRWSEPSIWNSATVPAADDHVTIPSGVTVTYDRNALDQVIAEITVAGTLTFATDRTTGLAVDLLTVAKSGTVQIGTAKEPLARHYTATIYLTGQEESLQVHGGRLELHGAPVNTTWTTLAHTAQPKSTALELTEAVDWQIGDHIVIASTSYAATEAEERVITTVLDEGRRLKLNQPLQYNHYGQHEQHAEVGLLTHNIVIRGDGDREPMDAGDTMIMEGSTVHVDNTEFTYLGTYGTLGKYPFHWHMAGNAKGSYLRGAAITHSGNRCVTLHGVEQAEVRDTVGYDTKGHCFFLEDGVEQRNQLIHNLGVLTLPGETLPTDARPATFWITNPNNIVNYNSAAGAQGFGFWFFVQTAATGLSADVAITPSELPLGSFHHNTAHSNYTGLDIDGHGFAAVSYKPIRPAHFDHILAYKNAVKGIWARGHNLHFSHITLVDNQVGASFPAVDSSLQHSLIIGESAEPSPNGFAQKIGFEFYDGPLTLAHTTFKNFQSTVTQRRVAISVANDNRYLMSPGNSFYDLRFRRATKFYLPDADHNGEKSTVLLNQRKQVMLTPRIDFHHTAGCTVRTDWNAYVCPVQSYGSLLVHDTRPNHADTLTVTRLDTEHSITLIQEGSSSKGRFYLNVPEAGEYHVSIADAAGLRLFFRGEGSITVHVPYTTRPTQVTDNYRTTEAWSYDEAVHEVTLTLQHGHYYQIW